MKGHELTVLPWRHPLPTSKAIMSLPAQVAPPIASEQDDNKPVPPNMDALGDFARVIAGQ